MIYIHFVVNPVSGKGRSDLSLEQIRLFFPKSQFRIEVDFTRYKGHAPILTKSILEQSPDVVVACGGDGTINEVASMLIGADVLLGIVPMGSGNGLAANLEMPKNVSRALETIRAGVVVRIDAGKVNDRYFFSNMGCGIDAEIIRRYESFGKRTLFGYFRAALMASRFSQRPYLLFVSNSNEMGYGMSLTPDADLSDGWLDVAVIEKANWWQPIWLGWKILRKKTRNFQMISRAKEKQLSVRFREASGINLQIDGEFYREETNKLEISVLEKALSVIVPEKSQIRSGKIQNPSVGLIGNLTR